MQTHRQEPAGAVIGRIERGKKTTGRIVASALGFAMAYYFDMEKGAERRHQLLLTAQRGFDQIREARAAKVADPAPVPHPGLRVHPETVPSSDRIVATG